NTPLAALRVSLATLPTGPQLPSDDTADKRCSTCRALRADLSRERPSEASTAPPRENGGRRLPLDRAWSRLEHGLSIDANTHASLPFKLPCTPTYAILNVCQAHKVSTGASVLSPQCASVFRMWQ